MTYPLVSVILNLASVMGESYTGGRIPFYFHSYPNAISTISDVYTTLYTNPKYGQQSGAQFPYTKVANTGDHVGLASVYLVGEAGRFKIDSGFAPIPQECSCYWLDVNELRARNPPIPFGKYQISMEEQVDANQHAYIVQSGFFRLRSNKRVKKPKAL